MPTNIVPILIAARSRKLVRGNKAWETDNGFVFPSEVIEGLCAAGWLEQSNGRVQITALGEQQLKIFERALALKHVQGSG
jgi:hypothetical protein